MHDSSSPLKLKRKTWEAKKGDPVAEISSFRERVSSFSLSFCTIRPLALFEARRKVALRGKGYAWVPNLRSLDKILEVGVSPYLGLFFV